MLTREERPKERNRHRERRDGEPYVIGCVFDVQPDLPRLEEALIDPRLD